MKMLNTIRMLALFLSIFAAQAHASVVISGTRVVFPANEREVTVKLTNDGATPVLVQAWLDNGDASASPEKIDVPFTLTPSMFRMEPGKGQSLRVIYTNEPLPADKETLFWLNVLEIPPKAASDDRNKIQFSIRTRIKLMFRPDGLPGRAEEAPAQVRWEIVRDGGDYSLRATNPTPYFVNLGNIELKSNGKKYEARIGFVPPGNTEKFKIEGLHSAPALDAKVKFSSINDWGGTNDQEQPVAVKD
ncbi:fimbria/pilus periplasmic chaperone [Burkholderia sp. Ac-20353]|uniref:fimbrial biogenesis chaperone n=1 Tax=Burkholderia sp. Ac-20353 TaxID=2703894 RepID=UPI00197BE353|nr:fimbria/pilus periplasmic chaperone [Burkholderia sp. Ac-20353]MBN3787640.1 fimbria/pilus periplasmic chaperone [Burkholderia sp. Ac-20353]